MAVCCHGTGAFWLHWRQGTLCRWTLGARIAPVPWRHLWMWNVPWAPAIMDPLIWEALLGAITRSSLSSEVELEPAVFWGAPTAHSERIAQQAARWWMADRGQAKGNSNCLALRQASHASVTMCSSQTTAISGCKRFQLDAQVRRVMSELLRVAWSGPSALLRSAIRGGCLSRWTQVSRRSRETEQKGATISASGRTVAFYAKVGAESLLPVAVTGMSCPLTQRARGQIAEKCSFGTRQVAVKDLAVPSRTCHTRLCWTRRRRRSPSWSCDSQRCADHSQAALCASSAVECEWCANLRGDCFRLELPSPLANFPTLGRVATASARGEKKGVLSRRIHVQKIAQDFR